MNTQTQTVKQLRLTLSQGDNKLTFTRAIDTEDVKLIAGSIAANVLNTYQKAKKFGQKTGINFSRKFMFELAIDNEKSDFTDVLGFNPADATGTQRTLKTIVLKPAEFASKVNKKGLTVRGKLITPAEVEKTYVQEAIQYGTTISEKNYMKFVEYVHEMTKAILIQKPENLVVSTDELKAAASVSALLTEVGYN